MKTKIIAALLVAASASLTAPAFAQSNQPVTRAQVRAEMAQLEQAGYNPARMNPQTYTQDIQAAEARLAQRNTAYGSSTNRSSQTDVAN